MKKVFNTVAVYLKAIVNGVMISYSTLMSWMCIVALVLLKDLLTDSTITEQAFMRHMVSYVYMFSVVVYLIRVVGKQMEHPAVELLMMLGCNLFCNQYVLINNMPLSSVNIEALLYFSLGIQVFRLILEIIIRITQSPDCVIKVRKIRMPGAEIHFWNGENLEDAYCRINNELAKLPEECIEPEDRRTTMLLNTLEYVEAALAEKYMKKNGYIVDNVEGIDFWKKN